MLINEAYFRFKQCQGGITPTKSIINDNHEKIQIQFFVKWGKNIIIQPLFQGI